MSRGKLLYNCFQLILVVTGVELDRAYAWTQRPGPEQKLFANKAIAPELPGKAWKLFAKLKSEGASHKTCWARQ